MLLKLFKGTGPGVIFLIIITLIAIWISAFLKRPMDSSFYYETDPMPLYRLLKLVFGNSHFFGVIFSFSMVALIAILLVTFNTKVFFINERTFLPALIYILFTGLFPQYQLLNPVLPASLFLMLAIIRIVDSYRKPGTAYNFFDAGILISTGSLFYANLIWFGLVVIIGIAILRTGNFREIAISIFGLITPYVLTFGFNYVMGKDISALFLLIENNLFHKSDGFLFSRLAIVVLIFTGMLILISIAYLFMVMHSKKIKSRQTFSLLLFIFLISAAVYFILPSVSVEIVWLMGLPVSYFLAHYFVFVKKKIVPEIIFSVLFIFILLIQIWYLK
jgi:hypothetical protein